MGTKIKWSNVDIALGKLNPWEHNPKGISKLRAERLLEYWQRIGQFQSIAIGPNNEVYDGHQRLTVLKAAFGDEYKVAARRSSRALTEDERKELVVSAHAGTTGQWDWDTLANWDADLLVDWGLDNEAIEGWQDAITAVSELMTSGINVKDDKLFEKHEAIRPREMFRILISVPLDYALDAKELVERIGEIDEAEIIYGAN